jgi:hypothetical protein
MTTAIHKTMCVVLALVGVIPPVRAFEVQADGSVKIGWVWHVTTCGQYTEDRRLSAGTGMSAVDRGYVAGWLSAYNSVVRGANLSGRDSRLDDVLLWLERYCRDHPFNSIQNGLTEFTFQVAPSLNESTTNQRRD